MVFDQRTHNQSQAHALSRPDQRTRSKTPIQNLSELEQIIARGDLSGHLLAFLLSCQVDGLSPFTVVSYKKRIGHFVRFVTDQGTAKPTDLTANHVRLFLLKKQENCGKVSIYNYFRDIRRFCNWLVAEGILKRSPMASMKQPRVPKSLIIPFTVDHIKRLLLLCDDRKFLGARNRAIILMFLDTGLRLSELANAQIKDVDFTRETVKVIGKGARERVVRIGKNTQKALLKYLLMRDDRLPCLWLTEEHKPLARWGIELMIHRLGKRAGIEGVRCSPHTFRHTFATRALLNGAGEFEVQSLLGHEGLDMTRRYAASLRSEAAVVGHRRFSPVDNMGLK